MAAAELVAAELGGGELVEVGAAVGLGAVASVLLVVLELLPAATMATAIAPAATAPPSAASGSGGAAGGRLDAAQTRHGAERRPGVDAAGGRGYQDAVNYDPHEDLYVCLGVPDTASQAEIKEARRARIQHAHPDKPTGDTTMAAVLNAAYDVLGNAEKRAAYDEKRRRYLQSVMAAAFTPKQTRPATRAKVRTRAAASVAPKVTRKAAAAPRKATRKAPAPAPSAVDFAVDNLMKSINNAEYGKAFGWFILGTLASDVKRRR